MARFSPLGRAAATGLSAGEAVGVGESESRLPSLKTRGGYGILPRACRTGRALPPPLVGSPGADDGLHLRSDLRPRLSTAPRPPLDLGAPPRTPPRAAREARGALPHPPRRRGPHRLPLREGPRPHGGVGEAHAACEGVSGRMTAAGGRPGAGPGAQREGPWIDGARPCKNPAPRRPEDGERRTRPAKESPGACRRPEAAPAPPWSATGG